MCPGDRPPGTGAAWGPRSPRSPRSWPGPWGLGLPARRRCGSAVWPRLAGAGRSRGAATGGLARWSSVAELDWALAADRSRRPLAPSSPGQDEAPRPTANMHAATSTTTLLLLLLAGTALAAVPDAARKPAPAADGTASTSLGAKKLDTASKCSGAVAFSGAGLKGAAAPKAAPIALRTTLLDKGVGWKPEDGEFVCYCPGTYQFAFAGDAAAKLVLKKKAAGGSSWSPVVAGPQHVVLLDMELGEAVAVFLDGGSQQADASATPAITFSGFRIAKKQ